MTEGSGGLEGFVPLRLLARLPDAEGPAETRFSGTALFADISGYTRLTEELCGASDEGLERLGQILDRSFARYVEVVERHGGEVAYFAGDALLALWDEGGAAARGRACARDLLALAAQPDQVGPGRGNPELHLGLASGSLWLARVGGWFGGWELLVGGNAVRDAFRAAAQAHAGTLVEVSAGGPSGEPTDERATAAGPDGMSQDGQDGPRRTPSDVAPAVGLPARNPPGLAVRDWYRALLPRVVLAARETTPAEPTRWPGELRRVSSLFVRIDGLDEAAPDALDRAQALAFALHEGLRESSGSAGRLVRDDKGLVFSLVLGDPFNAHADDVERALHTGLALGRALERVGFSTAMGFAAGRAFCGVVGSDVRRQYVVIGRPMNLAARLMQESDGTLLAAEPFAAQGPTDLTCVPAGVYTPKGFGQPVQTFRIGPGAVPLAPAPLCGRDAEMAELQGALWLLGRGEGGVRLLTGDAGMGKSRLIRELQGCAARAQVSTAVGAADPAEVSTSYYAWRGAFRALLGAPERASPAELRGRLPASLQPGGRDAALAPLLNAVLPAEIPENATTRGLPGPGRAGATAELLANLVEQLATRPLLIILEDCHWMDSASFGLAAAVAKRVRNVMLVLSARPMLARPELDPLRAHPRFAERVLGPLRRRDIEALVRQRSGGVPVAPALLEEIERQTAGNPFFVHEYWLFLHDRNRIRVHDGQLELHGPARAEAEMPRLEGIVTSRLDSLSTTEQLVLKAASAIGQVFAVRLLTSIFPVAAQRAQIGAALATLAGHQLVARADQAGQAFTFTHALIRNVAHELMLFEQRRALHREIALCLESTAFADLAAGPALLYHHWSEAADDERTLTYAERAASAALQLGANPEAITFLRRCRDLAGRLGHPPPWSLPQIRWRRQMSEAAGRLGDLGARREHAEAALVLAGHRPPGRGVSSALGTAGRLFWRALRRWLPGRPRPAEDPEVRDRELELARAHRHLSVVAYFANDPLGIVGNAVRALIHAERAGPSAELAGALVELGACFGLAGLGRVSDRFLAAALRRAERAGDLPSVAYTHMVRCLQFVGQGRWAEVMVDADACQSICETVGDHVNWANAQVVRYWLHHYRGEDEAARAAASALLARAERTGNLQQQAWALRCLALGELRAGAVDEAVEHLQAALDVLSGSRDHNEVVPTWGALALARHRRGDREQALVLAHRALVATLARGRPTGHGTLEGTAAVVEVMAAAGGDLRRFRQGVRTLARYARVFPIGVPRHALWRGEWLWRLGRRRAAQAAWQRGLAAARQLGMAHEGRLLALRLEETGAPVGRAVGPAASLTPRRPAPRH